VGGGGRATGDPVSVSGVILGGNQFSTGKKGKEVIVVFGAYRGPEATIR